MHAIVEDLNYWSNKVAPDGLAQDIVKIVQSLMEREPLSLSWLYRTYSLLMCVDRKWIRQATMRMEESPVPLGEVVREVIGFELSHVRGRV